MYICAWQQITNVMLLDTYSVDYYVKYTPFPRRYNVSSNGNTSKKGISRSEHVISRNAYTRTVHHDVQTWSSILFLVTVRYIYAFKKNIGKGVRVTPKYITLHVFFVMDSMI